MSIQKQYGSFYLICDNCLNSYPDINAPGFDTFQDTVDGKKQAGWKSRKNNGEWEDVYPECQMWGGHGGMNSFQKSNSCDALWLACQELENCIGTCPYDHSGGACDDVIADDICKGEDCDDDYINCWYLYFTRKAEVGKNKPCKYCNGTGEVWTEPDDWVFSYHGYVPEKIPCPKCTGKKG